MDDVQAGTTSDPVQDAENPTDTAATEVLDTLDAHGYTGQFVALAGGEVRCVTCGAIFPASGASTGSATRLEGASDPDDELLVIAVVCPVCSTKGSLTLGYGPVASAADQDVVVALDRAPAAGVATGITPDRSEAGLGGR